MGRRLQSFQSLKAVEFMEDASLIPGLNEDLALQCLARVPISSLWGVCRSWQGLVERSEDFSLARKQQGRGNVNWLYTLVRTTDGTFQWVAFDPLSEKWHPLPDMPERVDFQLSSPGSIGVSHMIQSVSTDTKLLMIAGLKRADGEGEEVSWSPLRPALTEPWVFHPEKRAWKKGKAFHTPRKWCACGAVGDKVYVVSGSGQTWDMALSRRVEEYDTEQDSWIQLPDLQSSKFSGEAITPVNVRGMLHMVSCKGVFIKEGMVLNPRTRSWTKMPSGMKRGWTGTCVSSEDRFYLVDDTHGTLSTYDWDTDRWTSILEDPVLKDITNVTAHGGLIFGLVSSGATSEGSLIRVMDVRGAIPVCHSLAVPQGQVVSMQILAKMDVGVDC